VTEEEGKEDEVEYEGGEEKEKECKRERRGEEENE
jgi:hypothetical protein